MYRILVNVNDKPSSRLIVDNINRLDDIVTFFLLMETGRTYRMYPSLKESPSEYENRLLQGEEVVLEYTTEDKKRVLLRIKANSIGE